MLSLLKAKEAGQVKDLSVFARDNNVKVRFTTLDPGVRGLATKTREGYLILIDKSLSPRQAKITARHEVWHIALGHLDERAELSDLDKEKEVIQCMQAETKHLPPEQRAIVAEELKQIKLPEKIETGQYQFVPFKVAGVSFESSGIKRQEYLHKIRYREIPFDAVLNVNLEQYEYQGEAALAVVVNNAVIGNVPRQLVQYLVENKSRILGTRSLNVYGGTEGKSYGCEVTLVLKN